MKEMPNLNYINSLRLLEKLMPLCLALFFTRTVFIGYKYLFLATLVPCFLYSVYMLFKQGVAIPKLKTLLLPFIVIALFFAHFSPMSNVVKESVNIALIVYFVAFSKMYYADDKCDAFLKWIVQLTSFAGCIAIIKFVLSMFGKTLPLSNVLFEGGGFSLVRDGNFYSLFFIIAIILSTRLFQQNKIRPIVLFVNTLISIINIGGCVSRRGYALYAIFVFALAFISLWYKGTYRKAFVCNISILLTIALCLIAVFVFGGRPYPTNMSYNQKYKLYKLHSLIDKKTSFLEFDINNQLKKFSSDYKKQDSSNLFWLEDIKNSRPWGYMLGVNDDLKFGLIEENDNYKIKLQRNVGRGEFQIKYTGRPIIYHKNVNYEISFAYRIIEGPANPFYVGWWVYEGGEYKQNLPQIITPIDSVWNECKVSYKFMNDHINATCFLNTLLQGSTIEVKDIRMTSDDTTGLPKYVDQLPDSVFYQFYPKGTTNYFTSPRTARWRYALELWQTRYSTKQKIFGQGFKYLEWYGEKFYNNPKRYDFPHNPIISSFLYSGIIGGVVYIIFLIMSLWLYWKMRKTMGIFFIMYLCCMFFSMFSGSSHFSFPLFAFLSFLPFVEYKNDNNSCEDLPANG